MRNLSLRIKYSFSKINSAFFCPHSFIPHLLSLIHISEIKGTVMQIEKALINDRLCVSKVS